METTQGKTIKTLSIVILVLSIIAFIAAIACTMIFGAGAAGVAGSMDDPEMQAALDEALSELQAEGSATLDISEFEADELQQLIDAGIIDENGNVTSTAAAEGTVAGLGFLAIWFIMIAIGAVITLVISIITLRRWDKPEKFNAVMGWAIAGAVFCLICGRIIILILFVVMAVLAYKGHPSRQNPYVYNSGQTWA